MKIAILSDIHANANALAKVLAAAKRLNVEQILVLGDCVGYYFQPGVVFDLLAAWPCEFIKGNHEHMLLQYLDSTEDHKESIRRKCGNGLDCCVQQLSAERIAMIRDWPDTKSVDFDGCAIQMCHGSPWKVDDYVYPDAEPELLNRCDLEGRDFVLMGHTHYPFSYKGQHSFIANVGAVGQSRVLGGIANWAIIDTANKSYKAMYSPFDIAEVQKMAKEQNPELPYLWEVLERNRFSQNG